MIVRLWRLLPMGLLVMLASCSTLAQDLPTVMPADFAVSLHEDGGMRPISNTFSLAANQGAYQKNYYYQGGNLQADFAFPLDTAALNQLYTTLRDCQLTQIRTRHEMIYDRGGRSIVIQYNQQAITISNAGTSLIEPAWTTQWKTAQQALLNLKSQALAVNGVQLTFTLSRAVVQAGDFYLGIDDDSLYYQPEAKPGELSVGLFPGQYLLTMYSQKTERRTELVLNATAAVSYLIELGDTGFRLKEVIK